MPRKILTAYWIESPRNVLMRFGVSGYSLADALQILGAYDQGVFVPSDLAGVRITEGITVARLDQRHVVPNMGPIAIRGMWYPFFGVGVPAWAEERMRENDYFPAGASVPK